MRVCIYLSALFAARRAIHLFSRVEKAKEMRWIYLGLTSG